jgi:hypothetical protein
LRSRRNNTGDVAELLLLTELVSRGLSVAIPFGHNNYYDVVVEHGVSKKLLKVQVKTANVKHNKNSYKFNDMTKYVGQVDFIAFLVEGDWYFWSSLKLKRYGTTSYVLLKLKYNVKNNWKVFGCE